MAQDGGWLKLWRKLRNNPHLADAVQRAVFLTVLLDAEMADHDRRCGHVVIPLKRGQAAVSTRKLASELKCGHQQIRRAIGNLEKGGIFNTRANTHVTVVTVCNFEKYQGTQHLSQHSLQHTANTRPTQLLEEEEGKEGEERLGRNGSSYSPTPESPSLASLASNDAKKGSRLGAGWEPSELQSAYARRLALDPRRTAADFRDYWLSKPGKAGLKLDWDRTWQTWCRNAADRQARFRGAAADVGRTAKWDGIL